MAVLVCGGAGYIGSHAVRELLAAGEEVIIADNLSTGHREAIPAVKFYECDIRDKAALKKIFAENKVEAVFHFAAFIEAGESVKLPLKYFNNNVYGMQILLEAMTECGVDKIIFSSSAAVYGEPEKIPIDEGDSTFPVNPYGDSKLIMEMMIRRVSAAQGVRYVSLRYFNASGATLDGSIGEDHHPESHLIPLILQVPLGKRDHITIFGDDYPTPDGTCIRDYIHVLDLANAHICALNYLRGGGESNFFNLGTGHGFSVKEIIDAAEKVTGLQIKKELGARRPGDPARLIASGEKARKILQWTPRFDDVEKIIATAWNWHKTHPNGYEVLDMIKIILSDIDGTFLKDDKNFTDLHAEALKAVVAKGLKFVFVSARMPEAIYPITDAIGMTHTPVISYGGGFVLTEDEEIIFDKKITAEDAQSVLAAMGRWNDITINYYSGRRWFVETIDKRVQFEMDITGATAEVASFDKLLSEKIFPNKVMVICEPPTCREMEIELGKKFPALNVVRSAPYLLEIMDKSVSKATGIKVLLKHYGFTVDEAIAFGDNYNDIEMLELIPQSVVMANAPDAVKKLAANVTDSNEDSGIYTYLVKQGII